MNATGLIKLGIALLVGTWMTFDGSRAIISGDYITPKSGPSAGQLGPWATVLRSIGVEPRSTAVKVLHILLGLLWLAAGLCQFRNPALGRTLLFVSASASLWYLPVGTALSLIELILLWMKP